MTAGRLIRSRPSIRTFQNGLSLRYEKQNRQMKACITLRFGSKPAVAAAIKNPTAAPTGAVIAKISQNKEVTSSFNRLPLRKSATRRPPEHTRERHSVARVQPSVH